jgi:hypothetical protein
VSVRASAGLATTIPNKDTSIGDVRVIFYRTFNKWSRNGPTGAPPPRPAAPPPMPNAPVPGATPLLEEEHTPAPPPAATGGQ